MGASEEELGRFYVETEPEVNKMAIINSLIINYSYLKRRHSIIVGRGAVTGNHFIFWGNSFAIRMAVGYTGSPFPPSWAITLNDGSCAKAETARPVI